LVKTVESSGQLRIAQIMRDWLRVVSLEPGLLRYSLMPGYAGDPSPELREALLKATGERWQVERSEAEGVPSLRELDDAAKAVEADALRRDPLVEAAFAAFPEAQFVDESEVADLGARKWSR
jgi:DNA polymerase-3 subunit gamma/tau